MLVFMCAVYCDGIDRRTRAGNGRRSRGYEAHCMVAIFQYADLLEQGFSPWGELALWVVEYWHPSLSTIPKFLLDSTICCQTFFRTFFRQDTASYTAEKDKFKIQGLELSKLIISKISQTSKLIAKTQPGYLRATVVAGLHSMQTNCPHELMATLAASHQTSSATCSLSALAHFQSIRQNGQSHPN